MHQEYIKYIQNECMNGIRTEKLKNRTIKLQWTFKMNIYDRGVRSKMVNLVKLSCITNVFLVKSFLRKIDINQVYVEDNNLIHSYTLVGVENRQNAWVNVLLLSGESWQFSKHEIYRKNKNRSSVCSYLLSELFYRVWPTGWFQSHESYMSFLAWSISQKHKDKKLMKNSWDLTGIEIKSEKREKVGSTKSTGEPDAIKWFWKTVTSSHLKTNLCQPLLS